jgi:hypothetical protein
MVLIVKKKLGRNNAKSISLEVHVLVDIFACIMLILVYSYHPKKLHEVIQ